MSVSPDHMQIIIKHLNLEYDERIAYIENHLDTFISYLTPFLHMVIKETEDVNIEWEGYKSACLSCSEVGTILAKLGRIKEARKMFKEEIEWAEKMFSLLSLLSNKSNIAYTTGMLNSHANYYASIGYEDIADKMKEVIKNGVMNNINI